ncbi:unnamed protein product [Protopolystoma xenopodis]|uniref:Uncharacterized protein n=1 Tax=Protopolystoma xenopodis TaxID=117903 RepID=A0A448WFE5_9PLAT|nr:unnamed protein product [Protopolystoma xenopodis]
MHAAGKGLDELDLAHHWPDRLRVVLLGDEVRRPDCPVSQTHTLSAQPPLAIGPDSDDLVGFLAHTTDRYCETGGVGRRYEFAWPCTPGFGLESRFKQYSVAGRPTQPCRHHNSTDGVEKTSRVARIDAVAWRDQMPRGD